MLLLVDTLSEAYGIDTQPLRCCIPPPFVFAPLNELLADGQLEIEPPPFLIVVEAVGFVVATLI